MKGLKEFLEALKENEGLLKEVEKVQDNAAKVVEIAKKNGYSFTEDEYMDAKMDAVSGGAGGNGSFLDTLFGKGKEFMVSREMTSEDDDFKYTRGKTGIHAYNKKTGQSFWQTNGSTQWTEV